MAHLLVAALFPDWPWSVCHRSRPPESQELLVTPNLLISSQNCLQTHSKASRGLQEPISLGELERTRALTCPRHPATVEPTRENSMALAQAVMNELSMLPGWRSVRSHPVPRLWGGGTGAVCPTTGHTTATLLPLPRQSPYLDLGGV